MTDSTRYEHERTFYSLADKIFAPDRGGLLPHLLIEDRARVCLYYHKLRYYVDDLYCPPGHRQNGLGSRLMARVSDELDAAACTAFCIVHRSNIDPVGILINEGWEKTPMVVKGDHEVWMRIANPDRYTGITSSWAD